MPELTAEERSLLDEIDRAFASAEKPEHCVTNYKHCDECAEHDEVLNRCTRETIGLEELGSPGWDPMCFASPEALVYYVPALARLALDRDPERYYLDQFLFHLGSTSIWRMTDNQTSTIAHLLEHVAETNTAQLIDEGQWDDLLAALRKLYLRQEGLPHPPELFRELD